MNSLWEIGLVWLVIYSVHSTLLLGLTWLVTHFAVLKSYRVHDTLWKVALVGSPISAALVTIMALPFADPSTDRFPVFWLGGSMLTAFGFGIAYFRACAFQRSAYPADVESQGLLDLLCAELRVQQQVTLLVSPSLSSPVALPHRRICVPEYVVNTLPVAHRRAILAHELAHILHRDNFWLALAGLLKAIFFLQPLNAIAYQRLQETAEYLADRWAVQQTGRPLVLAESIAEVAAHTLGESSPVPGLVATQSSLVRRVQYLVESIEYPHLKRSSVLFATMLASLLFTSVAFIVFANVDYPVRLAYHIPLFIWGLTAAAACFRYAGDLEDRVLGGRQAIVGTVLGGLLIGSIVLIVLVNDGRPVRLGFHLFCTIAPLLLWAIAALIARLRCAPATFE